MLPLTSMMTTCTIVGRIASASVKLCEVRLRYIETSAVSTPSTSETAVQSRNTVRVICPSMTDVK